jgi:hypothetical protein
MVGIVLAGIHHRQKIGCGDGSLEELAAAAGMAPDRAWTRAALLRAGAGCVAWRSGCPSDAV